MNGLAVRNSTERRINEIRDSITGVPKSGIPISFTELNNPTKYAVEIRNKDATNSLGLRVRDSANNELLTVKNTGVTLSNLTSIGSISAGHDTNLASYFGRAYIGYDGINSDYASFGHHDMYGVDSQFALAQSAAGHTILNAPTGQVVDIRINLVSQFQVSLNAVTLLNSTVVTWGTDVNIYRSAANGLKTDDNLTVSLGLNVGSATGAGSGQLKLGGAQADFLIIDPVDDNNPTWTAIGIHNAAKDAWKFQVHKDGILDVPGINVGSATGVWAGAIFAKKMLAGTTDYAAIDIRSERSGVDVTGGVIGAYAPDYSDVTAYQNSLTIQTYNENLNLSAFGTGHLLFFSGNRTTPRMRIEDDGSSYFLGGLNVGTATGAGVGQVKASGGLDLLYQVTETRTGAFSANTAYTFFSGASIISYYDVYLVTVHINCNGQPPYLVIASGIWSPCITNNNGENTYVPLSTSAHISGDYVISLASLAIAGNVRAQLNVKPNFAATEAGSTIVVRVRKLTTVYPQ